MNKILLILLVVGLLINVSSVYAQQEYTNNLWIDIGSFRDQMATHTPRVACNPNFPDECIVVNYFSGDFYTGYNPSLQLRYTTNGFETIGSAQNFPVTVDYNDPMLVWNISVNSALPYDVTYHDGKFWIVFKAGGQTNSYIYTWDVVNGFVQNSTKPNTYNCMEIVDENTEAPAYICIRHSQSSTKKVYYDVYYLVNGTGISTNNEITLAPCYSGVNYIFVRGFWEKSGSTHIHNISGYVKCGAGSWQGYSSVDMGTFNADNDAIWYWDGSRLFFRTNTSVRYVPTTDFSSFGDIIEYYTFNTSYAENINYTDYDDANGEISAYSFKAETNLTGRAVPFEYRRGMFASQQPLRELRIAYPTATNLDTGIIEQVNLTATLECLDFTHSQTLSGNFIDFSTPCENNTLTLINSDYYPLATSFNITLEDTCVPTTITINQQYMKSYTLELRTRDTLFYTPIDGVTVNIDDSVNTTNIQGIATIRNFFPVTGSEFSVQKIGCNYETTFSGTPKAISVLASKSGYQTYSKTEYFAESPFGDPFNAFTRDYLIEMTPPSTELEVKAYTLDNVEIESSSSQIAINVYGQDRAFLFQEGNYFEQSSSSELPSLFVLVDNRTNYSTNITLDFYGQHYQQNITVQQGGYKTAKFTVNFTSAELPCETNLDCPASFCDGKYYKLSKGCNANLCEYKTQICKSSDLCDAERGCFDAQGTQSCEDDTECIGQSFCLTTKKSRTGLCGSEDLCIFKDVVCSGECNQTTGLCTESDICLELGQIRHRFLIQTTTQPFIEGVYTTYVDTDYYCGLDNRGERECISGATIPDTPTLVGITTLPDNWENMIDENGNYVFYDISILCDNLCNITYEYCEYGCNTETGFCHHAPTETAGQIKGIFDAIAQMWWTFFPNIFVSSFVWIVISVIMSAGLEAMTGGLTRGAVFLGATMAFVGGGSVLGIVVNWFGLTYIIISGFLLWKFYRSV